MAESDLSFFMLAFEQPLPGSNVTCTVRQNSSLPIPGFDIYQGVPINLVLNIIVWLFLLICFTILRKVAWDYGRIALISRNDDQMRKKLLEENVSGSETISKLTWADNCSWICTFFKLTDTKIVQRCGRDAYIYLLFQRYLIAYVGLISILSLIIIVPVNLNGSYFSSFRDFGSLTIANSKTQYLWIHSAMALLYFLLAVVFMHRFSYCLNSIQEKMEESGGLEQNRNALNTLMISNIKNPNEETIKEYFTNRYSKESIVDIQLTYNVADLTKMDAKLKWATRARRNSEYQSNNLNIDLDIHPYPCGWMCSCCFCEACSCRKVNAVKFYSELEEKLRVDIEEEKTRIYSQPLGIIFVTLSDTETAERVYNDLRYNWRYTKKRGNVSSTAVSNTDPSNTDQATTTNVISTNDWTVCVSPPADNIIWENLSIFGYKWWLRAILLNITVLIICFFFTTPVVILEKSERFLHRGVNSVLDEFLPTVLLWLFACLLPNIIYYADQIIGHWTRDSEHHAVMTKTFTFLVLMVILLPSLGLTSVQGVLESKIVEHYQCIFASDNVAFFVNYVVTSAFIGTGLEILRVPQLLSYIIRIMLTRSPAERSAVRESFVYDYHFGFQYAWLLCITAVILTYSIPCPLIAPCGFIYLLAKQAVDRYNIYFAYRPLRVDIDLHTSAGNLFVAAAILIPGCILAFTSLRLGDRQTLLLESISIFALGSVVISLIVFIDHVRLGQLKRLSFFLFDKCWSRTVTEIPETRNTERPVSYVASVLQESKTDTPEPNIDDTTPQNYGSFANC